MSAKSKSVCSGRISSPFGTRFDPINKLLKEHQGVDIATPTGTTVYAPAGGEVVGVYTHASGGKTLILKSRVDGCELRFGFCHLSGYLVHQGQMVESGERLAKSGNTGRTTGPHLHFTVKSGGHWGGDDIYYGGGFVDPEPYLVCCDE